MSDENQVDTADDDDDDDMAEYTRALDQKRLDRIVGGLQAMAKLSPTGDVDTAAEHDVIYAGPASSPGDCPEVTKREPPELVAELCRLGWHWESDVDSWAIFT